MLPDITGATESASVVKLVNPALPPPELLKGLLIALGVEVLDLPVLQR